MKTGSIGSVSSGTMRTEDLIPDFTKLLKQLDEEKTYAQLIEDCEHYMDYEPEEQDDLLNDLFDALNVYAPSWCYFGAHPGNGSDYGFWVSETVADDFDGLKVNDTSEVPEDYTGEVLHANDHGNLTLYKSEKGKLTEIWAIV